MDTPGLKREMCETIRNNTQKIVGKGIFKVWNFSPVKVSKIKAIEMHEAR